MKILVTGAAGFLGRYVAQEAITQGHSVVGMGHAARSVKNNLDDLEEWVESDVTLNALRALTEAPDAIIHCAGGASVAQSFENPLEDFQRTTVSTSVVLEYARSAASSIKVVLPSSASIYGASERLPSTIDDSPNPISPYGTHKLMSETLCRLYAKQYGLSTAIVRLFSVYGPGLRKQLLWDACLRLEQGNGLFAGDGLETRHWLHAEDAATLILTAVSQASRDCPTANGAAGVPATVRSVIETLAVSFDAPPALAFSGVRRPGDPSHYYADLTEAHAWGWTPQIALETGLSDYVTWFRNSQL